jgi:hypothetical protein
MADTNRNGIPDNIESPASLAASQPSAFQVMSNVQGTGNLNAPNFWANAADVRDPFYLYAFATEPTYKAAALQTLNRSLNNTQDPTAKAAGFKNNFDYINHLLIKTGLAENVLGFGSALDKVITASIGLNVDPLSFLENYRGSLKGSVIKQPDTTTRYAQQIQTAMQFKDLGDARQYYNDAYFAAWGKRPSSDLDKKFQNAWNTQVRDQEAPTTTKTTTEYAPIYDKKSSPVIDSATGKQKVDKFGNAQYSKIAVDQSGQKRYTAITKGVTTSSGEGFTGEEQQQFLADFLVANNPNVNWSVENLGGAAKSLYDSINAFHKSNYTKTPDLVALSSVITDVLSNPDEQAAGEVIAQYQTGVRKQTASKYMSLAEYVNAGDNADKYVKPLLETVSAALEKNFTIDDPFVVSILNFKDESGTYRVPNALELNNMIMSHKDYGKTSKAINEAVDLSQNLRSKLGRG